MKVHENTLSRIEIGEQSIHRYLFLRRLLQLLFPVSYLHYPVGIFLDFIFPLI